MLNNKYKFTTSNEIFHQYTYEAFELLSLGVYIDVHLSAVNENKTEIIVEIRRKLGSFDQSHEVTKANDHLVKIFDIIGKLTAMPVDEIEQLKSQQINHIKPKANQFSGSSMDGVPPGNPWYEKKGLVFLLCVIFFPVGLYALWKNSSIKTLWKIVWTILIAVIVINVFSGSDKKSTTVSNVTNPSSSTADSEKKSSGVDIGQVLKTDYFDITVNKAEIQKTVHTGNQYTDLKKEDGINYLLIEANFKNTDNESRMLDDGSVWINYNGKDYEFDKTETVMAEGYGLLLEQINPLTSKTTILVYKIPAEIKGDAYWQPGRANDNERIFLGNL